MFRIDRRLVNLEPSQSLQANTPEAADKAAKEAQAPVSAPADPLDLVELSGQEQPAEPVEQPAPPPEEDVEHIERAEQRIRELTEAADEMVRQAELKAKMLVQNAEIEAINIRSQGWEAGYDEGRTEFETERLQQMAEDRAALERVIGEVVQARKEILDGLEDEIVDLALAVAKKIVNVAIQKDDIIFESILKNALHQMKREGKITIRVSGQEYERFFSSGSATFVLGDESVTATIVNDPLLPEGGGIVESEGETINAGVDSQLRYIAIAFKQSEGQG